MGRVGVTVDAIDTYYLAASHHAPVRELTVTNVDLPAGAGDLVVRRHVESPFGHPEERSVPVPLPGASIRFGRVRMRPNHQALAHLEERVAGHIVATVEYDGVILGEASEPVTFLAHNQWMYSPAYYDSLAAFVQPTQVARDGPLVRRPPPPSHAVADPALDGRHLHGARLGWFTY